MSLSEITLRLVLAAHEQGWRDACDDHMSQRKDATHPIGQRKVRAPHELMDRLDPIGLLGLDGVTP